MKIYTTKCKACGATEEVLYCQGDTLEEARARLEEWCTAKPKLCHFGRPPQR